MEFVLIKRDSPEWDFIWEWLKAHPINEGLEQPDVVQNEDEAWQYTGSFMNGKKAVHSFRHRCFPKTGNVVNLSLNASDSFTDDQIEVKKKM
jgi:hypothetical protein